MLATTPEGQLLSGLPEDGVRRPVAAAPLAFVDWQSTELLVGIAADGMTYASDDSGALWAQSSRVAGIPTALTVSPDQWYAASSRGVVYVSSDEGTSFQALVAFES